MFERLAARANADPNVRRLGRNCSMEFALVADGAATHVRVRNGEVVDVLQGPFKMRAAAFRIDADATAWRAFMTPRPRPGLHDIFAMSATGNARIEGDIDALLTHLGFVKALLATLRQGS